MSGAFFKVSEDVVFRKNSDGSIILIRMDDSDIFYKIDGLAADFFFKIKEGKELNDAICEINIERPQSINGPFREDIEKLLNELLKLGIISGNATSTS